jgi:uncharacterized protein
METNVRLDANNKGAIYLEDDGKEIGRIEIGVKHQDLTAYHTEVDPKYQGHGYSVQLVEALVDYARKNNLKIIALCSFVFSHFKKHAAQYADIWKQ